MSVETWPPIPPHELKIAEETTNKRELEWLLDELHEILKDLKHGLEDCYALLAPVDPGSTLVVSTHRNEIVKGHVTRVGTRIVKGTLHLRMRTLPPQTFTVDPDQPIHLGPLGTIHTLLTNAIDFLTLTLSYTDSSNPSSPTSTSRIPAPHPQPNPSSASSTSKATFISANLRLLSQALTDASALLKGPQPLTASDPNWTRQSCSPAHFLPPTPGPNLSFYWGVQDSSLVLWLRALEPADAPVHFGTKLALAIGTTRRLEHDEADQQFRYVCPPAGGELGGGGGGGKEGSIGGGSGASSDGGDSAWDGKQELDVFVREKVRVESADPSLLSLSAKLVALGHTLALARRNLAAVMGEEIDD
ncbi:37S ribosomal protein rsm22 [Pleurostoma richardsiae]|uniref:37S ribosomal protein rsm22 n=1 Tax=Pleurostoma richardsiae TaxID=41990 RepID=A0AA38S312_9PEZI|nr:37S ribosomal protein rsm22 [Pleurostoma richardsiae]